MGLVTRAFIAAVNQCSWEDDHLVYEGDDLFPYVTTSGVWALGASGQFISQASYFTLVFPSSPNPNGSYISGVMPYPSTCLITSGSWALAEPGSGPPPA